jgi:F-type H+-transporting ATPase subunit alpha
MNPSITRVLVICTAPLSSEKLSRIKEICERKLKTKVDIKTQIDPSVLGGVRLKIGDKIIEFSAKSRLFEDEILTREVGRVLSLADNVIHLDGLSGCFEGEFLELSGGAFAIAMNLEKTCVKAAILKNSKNVAAGSQVKRTGKTLSVPVGNNLLGRVVSALGEPLDGLGRIVSDNFFPIERKAPEIMERKSVNVPLETGIKAIDMLVPIGRGQRELIIGDRGTGKTSIAIDTIINQRDKNVVCVYVAIGQKQSSLARTIKKLDDSGALKNTVIVSASAADLPVLQYVAPYAGCAMAEFFMDSGRDVLIVYDDLSKHAAAYRALSLLLRRSPGREAYPGDVFYLHSRLLERAANLRRGGSITALPIIETQEGDVSSYIPTNVISITDGQIFLETESFNRGIIPAINPGISVSRVGGAAQIPEIRKISGKLKLIYSQFKELENFARFGSEQGAETEKRLARGREIVELLKQPENSPVTFLEQARIFSKVVNE